MKSLINELSLFPGQCYTTENLSKSEEREGKDRENLDGPRGTKRRGLRKRKGKKGKDFD